MADLSLHISIALLNLSLAFIQLSLRLGMSVLGCKLSVEPLPPVQAQLLLQGLLLLQCLCITLMFTAVQVWRCDQPWLLLLKWSCQVQAVSAKVILSVHCAESSDQAIQSGIQPAMSVKDHPVCA